MNLWPTHQFHPVCPTWNRFPLHHLQSQKTRELIIFRSFIYDAFHVFLSSQYSFSLFSSFLHSTLREFSFLPDIFLSSMLYDHQDFFWRLLTIFVFHRLRRIRNEWKLTIRFCIKGRAHFMSLHTTLSWGAEGASVMFAGREMNFDSDWKKGFCIFAWWLWAYTEFIGLAKCWNWLKCFCVKAKFSLCGRDSWVHWMFSHFGWENSKTFLSYHVPRELRSKIAPFKI